MQVAAVVMLALMTLTELWVKLRLGGSKCCPKRTQIFLTTSALYLIWTVSYVGLIRVVERRETEKAVLDTANGPGSA